MRRDRRRALVLRVALASVCLAGAVVTAAALAAQPRKNAAYTAISNGHHLLSLTTTNTKTMSVFFCYDRHGNFPWDALAVPVKSDGSFSYHGPAENIIKHKHGTLKISGHFVTRDKAVGHITGPCVTNRAFTARYSPGR